MRRITSILATRHLVLTLFFPQAIKRKVTNFAYSMFELKAASQRSKTNQSKTGSVSYEKASHEKETWYDRVMGKAKEAKAQVAKTRDEFGSKLRQTAEKIASEKLGVPAYKLHLPTKLKQNTKAVASEAKSMTKWWGASELRSLVSYGAVNIFGQLDIWGKEFSKALWGGINSLPGASGKSQVGGQMLDAMLARQASSINIGK